MRVLALKVAPCLLSAADAQVAEYAMTSKLEAPVVERASYREYTAGSTIR
jgi:hypothetical protein